MQWRYLLSGCLLALVGALACGDDEVVSTCYEDAQCGTGRVCVGARCVPGICPERACSESQRCVSGVCLERHCPRQNCAAGEVCVAGLCLEERCIGVECPQGERCAQGDCHPRSCGERTCGEREVCWRGDCVATACVEVVCPAGERCLQGRCTRASCSDGTRNGSETDIDCGGDCPPCGDGRGCAAGGDCESGRCDAGVCAAAPSAPTCTDGARNGGESDVGCGGGSCPPCANGATCSSSGDCQSGNCEAGGCVERPVVPGCSDGIRNGDESDVDCGGSCPACGAGRSCVVAADCQGLQCREGTCRDAAGPAVP